MHATLIAGDFFLAYFYPSGPFTCIISKPLPVLAVANTCSCVGPQDKIGQPAGGRVECPRNINRLKKHDLWYDDCEMNNLEIE